jgi:hypothetical protein
MISMMYGSACPNPIDNPLCLETPTLIPWTPLLLTWKSLLCDVAQIPVHSDPWLAVHWPPLPPSLSSPFPFPFPIGSPFQIHVLLRRNSDIGFTQSDSTTNNYKFLFLFLLSVSRTGSQFLNHLNYINLTKQILRQNELVFDNAINKIWQKYNCIGLC